MTEADKAKIRSFLRYARTSQLIVFCSNGELYTRTLEQRGLINGWSFTPEIMRDLVQLLADVIDERFPVPNVYSDPIT